MADDLRAVLLCGRDDAPVDSSLRPIPARDHLSSVATTVRRHDRGREAHEQDGTRVATGVRSNAGAPLGYQHGELHQQGRLLPP